MHVREVGSRYRVCVRDLGSRYSGCVRELGSRYRKYEGTRQ